METSNPAGFTHRLTASARDLKARFLSTWAGLPPGRRNRLISLLLMTGILAALLVVQRPAAAPGETGTGPEHATAARSEPGRALDPVGEAPVPSPSPAATDDGGGPANSADPRAGSEMEPPTVPVGAEASAAVPEQWARPVTGSLLDGYGWRHFPDLGDWRLHAGLDYEAPENTPVFAAAPGIVEAIMEDPVYGLTVVLDHGGGIRTRYSGLKQVQVELERRVSEGQQLAVVGTPGAGEQALGPHLHFEVERQGDPVPPDPQLH